MPTNIALIRGINVGGTTTVKMADLVSAFELLGFANVRTYVQSGNVVFDARQNDPAALASTIEKKLQQAFASRIRVVVRSAEQLAALVRRNSLAAQHPAEADKLHVTFLSNVPDMKIASALQMPKHRAEEFRIAGSEILLYLPNGYGRTKLSNNAFEKKLGCAATTRNWKTVTALAEMTVAQR